MNKLTYFMRIVIGISIIKSKKEQDFIRFKSVESTYLVRIIIEILVVRSRKENFIEMKSDEGTYSRDENDH